MRKRKLFLVTCSLLCVTLLLAACFGEIQTASTSAAATDESTVPTESIAATQMTQPSTETTQPPPPYTAVAAGEITYLVPTDYPEIDIRECYDRAPTLPIPAEDAPESDWISFFYALLTDYGSWYQMAVTSHYANTKELSLRAFLSGGISEIESDLTEEELAWLVPQGHHPSQYCLRMPSSEIDTLLQIYFGTSLTEYNFDVRYYDVTDCYYYSPGGPLEADVLGIVGYETLENGDVLVRYATDFYSSDVYLAEVTLHPVENYYQVVSNLPVEPAFLIDDLI